MKRLVALVERHILFKSPEDKAPPSSAPGRLRDVFEAEAVADVQVIDKWEVYKRLLSYFRPYWPQALVALLITIPIGGLDGAIAYSLKPFVNSLAIKKSLENVFFAPFIILGFTVLQGVLFYVSTYTNGWLGMKVSQDLRRELLLVLQRADVEAFDTTSSGKIFQCYYRDPESVKTELLINLKSLLTRMFSSLALLGVLFYCSWKLALIALVSTLFILLPATRVNKFMRRLVNADNRSVGHLTTFYNDTVGGIRTIYGYNAREDRLEYFEKLQSMIFNQSIRMFQVQGWLTPIMHVVSSVSIALIIWLGTSMVVSGELTTGAFVSFFAALLMLYNPLKNLGKSMVNTERALIIAQRIFSLLDRSSEVSCVETQPSDVVPLPGFRNEIRLDNVCFSYQCRPEHPILQGINLIIHKGETIALVGQSGGGKTTLANLIPRFYDVTEGSIRIDEKDIREYSLQSIRQHIAVVFQDNFHFHGTIRENLLIGKPEASEEQLYAALQKAYLADFVLGLPDQLDTPIGERGVLLSGGQKQRLSLARAFLKDAPILILDEATSALDNQSEAIVQKALEDLRKERTVLIVAHRLSTIRHADRILVLEQGQIKEIGTHEALLEKNGLYARLYCSQLEESRNPICAPAV